MRKWLLKLTRAVLASQALIWERVQQHRHLFCLYVTHVFFSISVSLFCHFFSTLIIVYSGTFLKTFLWFWHSADRQRNLPWPFPLPRQYYDSHYEHNEEKQSSSEHAEEDSIKPSRPLIQLAVRPSVLLEIRHEAPEKKTQPKSASQLLSTQLSHVLGSKATRLSLTGQEDVKR